MICKYLEEKRRESSNKSLNQTTKTELILPFVKKIIFVTLQKLKKLKILEACSSKNLKPANLHLLYSKR